MKEGPETNRQTDRQTDKLMLSFGLTNENQTDRQADSGQIDRQID